MAYKVIILYRLYMPSYFLGTFTEYPEIDDLLLPYSVDLSIYGKLKNADLLEHIHRMGIPIFSRPSN